MRKAEKPNDTGKTWVRILGGLLSIAIFKLATNGFNEILSNQTKLSEGPEISKAISFVQPKITESVKYINPEYTSDRVLVSVNYPERLWMTKRFESGLAGEYMIQGSFDLLINHVNVNHLKQVRYIILTNEGTHSVRINQVFLENSSVQKDPYTDLGLGQKSVVANNVKSFSGPGEALAARSLYSRDSPNKQSKLISIAPGQSVIVDKTILGPADLATMGRFEIDNLALMNPLQIRMRVVFGPLDASLASLNNIQNPVLPSGDETNNRQGRLSRFNGITGAELKTNLLSSAPFDLNSKLNTVVRYNFRNVESKAYLGQLELNGQSDVNYGNYGVWYDLSQNFTNSSQDVKELNVYHETTPDGNAPISSIKFRQPMLVEVYEGKSKKRLYAKYIFVRQTPGTITKTPILKLKVAPNQEVEVRIGFVIAVNNYSHASLRLESKKN